MESRVFNFAEKMEQLLDIEKDAEKEETEMML